MNKIIKVYAVHQGDDDRSSGYPVWFFDDFSKAKTVAAKRGWYGGEAPITERYAICVSQQDSWFTEQIRVECNEYYLLDNTDPIKLNEGPDDILRKKQAALAKLTPEDRKVLGLE